MASEYREVPIHGLVRGVPKEAQVTEICFRSIRLDGAFSSDFGELKANNVIRFSQSGIVVLYGPNGAGKTSLSRVLSNEGGSEYALTLDGKELTNKDESVFHVIEDQNGRNIIQGSTEDFVLGDNVRREYELKAALDKGFSDLFSSVLIPSLKGIGISKKKTRFDSLLTDMTLRAFVSDLANVKSKGEGIDRRVLLDWSQSRTQEDIPDYDQAKFDFLVSDYSSNISAIEKVLQLSGKQVKADPGVMRIEENDDAIRILEKYDYATDCIVCDRDIDRPLLLEKKRSSKATVLATLSDETKEVLNSIIDLVNPQRDPFGIRAALVAAIRAGDVALLLHLLATFRMYFRIYELTVLNLFSSCLRESTFAQMLAEYETIIQEKPRFEGDDILFIERFVNECLNRKIELKRDGESNIRVMLGDTDLLGQARNALHLSNGEQNFISLAFELLKAKKLKGRIVIIDDPISSFDSIYKNKIAYAIIKFLENHRQIVLTHNTDLITLLEHQKQKCFNLYLLNNTEGERNGFIEVKRSEQDLVLYIHKLLDFFRGTVADHIQNERLFMMSVIPFMRGFSQVIGDRESRDRLTKVMHGYETESIDVGEIYKELFGVEIVTSPVHVSARDIIATDLSDVVILKGDGYPLLEKTLRHGLTYLWLRLRVEEALVNKFSIDTGKHKMLNQIIQKAYGSTSENDVEARVFLLSRKTLLNEFNHFEVDLNLFKPAIDITDSSLAREKQDIVGFLDRLSPS